MKFCSAVTVLSLPLVLTGCQLLPLDEGPAEVTTVQPEICLVTPPEQDFDHNCDILHWLTLWAESSALPWAQRKEQIQALGDSTPDTLQKVFLSQGANTPYQDRLRAQGWLENVLKQLTPPAQAFLVALLHQPAQDLLEFESALAVMSRINVKQEEQIKQQQQELVTKQNQIEQLLTIEASMIEEQQEQ